MRNFTRGQALAPYTVILPSHFCVSAKDVCLLPQLGGTNYDQALRSNEFPSMRIARPLVPTEVLNALSAQAGDLSVANDLAVQIARNTCDKSFSCPCKRCSSVRGQLIEALRPTAPRGPPPRMTFSLLPVQNLPISQNRPLIFLHGWEFFPLKRDPHSIPEDEVVNYDAPSLPVLVSPSPLSDGFIAPPNPPSTKLVISL